MAITYGKNYGRPTLDLNFAENKSLIDSITGRNLITFSRSQSGKEATYVGSDGLIKYAGADEPRFDYDPETGESLGLLIEEQRTNFETNSRLTSLIRINATGTAGDGFYDALGTTGTYYKSPNKEILPDGSIDYVAQFYFNGQNPSSINESLSFGSAKWNNVGYIRSFYVKVSGPCTLPIINNNGFPRNFYTFTNDDVGKWRRVVTPVDQGGANAPRSIQAFEVWNFNKSKGYTTSNLLKIQFALVQVELGDFPTSYIPTSGAQVTRNADEASITGTNFSSGWFNSSEGTLFSNIQTPNTSCFGWNLHDGSNNNRFVFDPGTDTGTAAVVISASGTTFGTPPTVIAGGGKIAYGYKANDYGVYGDNVRLAGTSPGAVPSGLIELALGYRGASPSDAFLNGHISSLTYWPKRLPDLELQQLTK
jgi:hypothetical protein